jgi:hypothetical protein
LYPLIFMIGFAGEKLSACPMVHVVLDTNIFSSNRRRDSGPFHALVRLCNGSKVSINTSTFCNRWKRPCNRPSHPDIPQQS